MKKNIAIVITLMLLISLTSCEYRYRDEHRDLYTVAVNNIFGIRGYDNNGEVAYDPEIEILEEDNYGRVLYIYQELLHRNVEEEGYYGGLVIMQCSDESYAYYLNNCYIPVYTYLGEKTDYKTYFTDEQINDFKKDNHWNKELEKEYLLRSPLINIPPQGNLSLQNKDFEKIIREYVKDNGYKGDDTIYRYSHYCQTDKNGLELYYIYGIGRDVEGTGVSPTSKTKYYEFAIIFTVDGTSSIDFIVEIDCITNTEELVTEIKNRSGWIR